MTNNQYQFRKGHLARSSKNPYQDPTLLSFTLIFDTTSPLFNPKVAVKTLREFYLETERANKLERFINTILLINREMPWYWISLDGVMKAFEYNLKEPYRGGDEAQLSITCNESINLAITGLMDTYRDSVYDLAAWTQVLPENYRNFRMWVVVSEIREFNTQRPTGKTMAETINEDITGDFKPLFKIQYDFCTFNIQSAKEAFENLSSSSPESPSPKVVINYEAVKVVETSYLHGLMTEEIGDLGIAPGKPTGNIIRSIGDRLSTDGAQILNTASAGLRNSMEAINPINVIKRLTTGDGNVYGSPLEQAYQRALNEIDGVAFGASRFPENIFRNASASAVSEALSFKTSLKSNIFGNQFGTVGAALRQGSLNAVFPLINKP